MTTPLVSIMDPGQRSGGPIQDRQQLALQGSVIAFCALPQAYYHRFWHAFESPERARQRSRARLQLRRGADHSAPASIR